MKRVLWVVGAVALASFWAVAVVMQGTMELSLVDGVLRAHESRASFVEILFIGAQVVAVPVSVRLPVIGAALASGALVLTALTGHQGSIAVGLLPIVVMISGVCGGRREAVGATVLVFVGWLFFILAVRGPMPAASEYVGVVLGTAVPFGLTAGVRHIRVWRQASPA